jgi:hypothetical protein
MYLWQTKVRIRTCVALVPLFQAQFRITAILVFSGEYAVDENGKGACSAASR